MIKIDFHIHTVATPSDTNFEFSLNTLKRYVSEADIDAVAITNHNLFDLNQYNEIKKELDIVAYPGIEINLEAGHLLLVGDGNELGDFAVRCEKVSQAISSPSNHIDVSTLKEIFSDLERYILIPHYDKRPSVHQDAIKNLSPHVTAGEVQSPKKFMYCKQDDSKLVPVYFSDSRMSEDLNSMPVRQTYLNCGNADFPSIKDCLRDKNKVALSKNETGRLFRIFEDGQNLNFGLNVVLGERSTGKSFTLDKIEREFENVRYLKQFSLVEKNEEEDERRFNEMLSKRHSLFTVEYLNEFRNVVNDVIGIDINADERTVHDYIESLLKHAKESERHDIFSKARLFSEEGYVSSSDDQQMLGELIDSTKHLIENIEFREIVKKHIPLESLKNLIIELIREYSKREEVRLKEMWINDLVSEIKQKLDVRTASVSIKRVNFYNVVLNKRKVDRFNELVRRVRSDRIIQRKPIQGFEVVARAKPFDSPGALKKLSKSKKAFSDAFKEYNSPYQFLQELKKIDGIEDAEYYKYFAEIKHEILNRDGYEVSGGERSEFNLLQEIHDARKYDMLLIDEPESSFDNLFLRGEVNQLIKNISRDMPVVVVTHNNTVGASIKPDYLLYTKKDVSPDGIQYKLYSGFPSDKKLFSSDGSSISTFEVTMECLESGEEAYDERRGGYENLKD